VIGRPAKLGLVAKAWRAALRPALEAPRDGLWTRPR
jgi:hypothetical protein